MSHVSIADCCVVGVYDSSQATEIPRAYVVLQPSIKNNKATTDMISKFVEDSVINYKKLRGGVRVVGKVPKSASGKILRREVKEWIKEEQRSETLRARI
jgi:4-coumarate--CoA ligase